MRRRRPRLKDGVLKKMKTILKMISSAAMSVLLTGILWLPGAIIGAVFTVLIFVSL